MRFAPATVLAFLCLSSTTVPGEAFLSKPSRRFGLAQGAGANLVQHNHRRLWRQQHPHQRRGPLILTGTAASPDDDDKNDEGQKKDDADNKKAASFSPFGSKPASGSPFGTTAKPSAATGGSPFGTTKPPVSSGSGDSESPARPTFRPSSSGPSSSSPFASSKKDEESKSDDSTSGTPEMNKKSDDVGGSTKSQETKESPSTEKATPHFASSKKSESDSKKKTKSEKASADTTPRPSGIPGIAAPPPVGIRASQEQPQGRPTPVPPFEGLKPPASDVISDTPKVTKAETKKAGSSSSPPPSAPPSRQPQGSEQQRPQFREQPLQQDDYAGMPPPPQYNGDREMVGSMPLGPIPDINMPPPQMPRDGEQQPPRGMRGPPPPIPGMDDIGPPYNERPRRFDDGPSRDGYNFAEARRSPPPQRGLDDHMVPPTFERYNDGYRSPPDDRHSEMQYYEPPPRTQGPAGRRRGHPDDVKLPFFERYNDGYRVPDSAIHQKGNDDTLRQGAVNREGPMFEHYNDGHLPPRSADQQVGNEGMSTSVDTRSREQQRQQRQPQMPMGAAPDMRGPNRSFDPLPRPQQMGSRPDDPSRIAPFDPLPPLRSYLYDRTGGNGNTALDNDDVARAGGFQGSNNRSRRGYPVVPPPEKELCSPWATSTEDKFMNDVNKLPEFDRPSNDGHRPTESAINQVGNDSTSTSATQPDLNGLNPPSKSSFRRSSENDRESVTSPWSVKSDDPHFNERNLQSFARPNEGPKYSPDQIGNPNPEHVERQRKLELARSGGGLGRMPDPQNIMDRGIERESITSPFMTRSGDKHFDDFDRVVTFSRMNDGHTSTPRAHLDDRAMAQSLRQQQQQHRAMSAPADITTAVGFERFNDGRNAPPMSLSDRQRQYGTILRGELSTPPGRPEKQDVEPRKEPEATNDGRSSFSLPDEEVLKPATASSVGDSANVRASSNLEDMNAKIEALAKSQRDYERSVGEMMKLVTTQQDQLQDQRVLMESHINTTRSSLDTLAVQVGVIKDHLERLAGESKSPPIASSKPNFEVKTPPPQGMSPPSLAKETSATPPTTSKSSSDDKEKKEED